MSPITKPNSGLLALQAAAADTGVLYTVLRSAALLVFFDREQTRAGGFKAAVGHDYFSNVLVVCRSYASRHASHDPGRRCALSGASWTMLGK